MNIAKPSKGFVIIKSYAATCNEKSIKFSKLKQSEYNKILDHLREKGHKIGEPVFSDNTSLRQLRRETEKSNWFVQYFVLGDKLEILTTRHQAK